MNEEKFEMKPWMWILTIIAVLLLFFNIDPVGDILNNAFGKGADRWAINIVTIGLIIYILGLVIKKK
ncbi:MAG: hypothetical protein HYS02_01980 [Candidatus Staskawiczbacteria bacterium]|nr:hypothetical protein [Candidatus Staskawiczbacteria bacterium]